MEKEFRAVMDTATMIIAGFVGGIAGQYVGSPLPEQLGAIGGLFIVVLPSLYLVYWAISKFSDQEEN